MSPFNFRFGALVIATTAVLISADSAQAATMTNYAGRLDHALDAQESMDPYTAANSIVAWVCEESTGTTDGVKFEACSGSAANLVANEELGLNFLAIANSITQSATHSIGLRGESVETFWDNFGVTPLKASQCADAMLNYMQSSGLFDSLTASDRFSICHPSNLFEAMIEETKTWSDAASAELENQVSADVKNDF